MPESASIFGAQAKFHVPFSPLEPQRRDSVSNFVAVETNSHRNGTAMSEHDLKAELERLRSENAALKKGAASSVRMKVSEKGALSVYGMGRFPVTLYKEQWLKLLDMTGDIRAFIAAHETQLKTKE